MKICFFMNTPFSLGGEQRVVTLLANYLVKKGYEVTFLLLDNKQNVEYEKYGLSKKNRIIFLKKYGDLFPRVIRQFNKILNKLNYKFGLIKSSIKLQRILFLNNLEKKYLLEEINNNNFDYIIGIGGRYTAMLSILKNEIKNAKIIGWQHSTFEAYFRTPYLRFYNCELFSKFMFQNLDYYIVQTENDRNKIYNTFNYDAIVINNPNTFDNIDFYTTDIYKRYQYKCFITVGRLVKIKNIDFIIDSFYEFSKINHEWKLQIIGDGKEYKNLRIKINKLKLNDRVELIRNTDDVQKYYSTSSAYLMCSEWEGWGMSVTEAMNFGHPIIAFDLPSMREIFGKSDCGFLIEKKNRKIMVEKMLEIANNYSAYKYFSINSFEQVKKFNVNKIGSIWDSLFLNLKEVD